MFVIPVIYHHIEFPYRDVTKFIRRSHRFILFGFLPTGMSLYLGMVLAFSQIINDYAFFVAILPFGLVFVLYQMRKLGWQGLDPEVWAKCVWDIRTWSTLRNIRYYAIQFNRRIDYQRKVAYLRLPRPLQILRQQYHRISRQFESSSFFQDSFHFFLGVGLIFSH